MQKRLMGDLLVSDVLESREGTIVKWQSSVMFSGIPPEPKSPLMRLTLPPGSGTGLPVVVPLRPLGGDASVLFFGVVASLDAIKLLRLRAPN